jgi:hypothetical protein
VFNIINAEARAAEPVHASTAIFGPSGVGKTHLARTLDPNTTLFVDLEAGTMALGNWPGDVVRLLEVARANNMHAWEVCRAVACLLCGPDPTDYALNDMRQLVPGPYSAEAHASYIQQLGDPTGLFGKYQTIFLDSITVASRWSFAWCETQPSAISDRGKVDTRGIYGTHGKEMIRWLTRLQHAPYATFLVGILEAKADDMGRISFVPQVDGSGTGRALPGIFDNVLTLTRFNPPPAPDQPMAHEPIGGAARALVCTGNVWGLPGKNRSAALGTLEPPDLGALLAKMKSATRPAATKEA